MPCAALSADGCLLPKSLSAQTRFARFWLRRPRPARAATIAATAVLFGTLGTAAWMLQDARDDSQSAAAVQPAKADQNDQHPTARPPAELQWNDPIAQEIFTVEGDLGRLEDSLAPVWDDRAAPPQASNR